MVLPCHQDKGQSLFYRRAWVASESPVSRCHLGPKATRDLNLEECDKVTATVSFLWKPTSPAIWRPRLGVKRGAPPSLPSIGGPLRPAFRPQDPRCQIAFLAYSTPAVPSGSPEATSNLALRKTIFLASVGAAAATSSRNPVSESPRVPVRVSSCWRLLTNGLHRRCRQALPGHDRQMGLVNPKVSSGISPRGQRHCTDDHGLP